MMNSYPLLSFFVRRLLYIAVMIFGLMVITFLISRVAGGDPARLVAGEDATEATVALIKQEFNLDKPLPQQFYLYLKGFVNGDWGKSIQTSRPVLDDILLYFPATLELIVYTMLLTVALALPLGVISAVYQNTWIDQFTRFFSVSAVAIPSFWAGIIFLWILAGNMDWFPSGGRIDVFSDPPPTITGFYTVDFLLQGNFSGVLDSLWYMVLPVLTLSLPAIASIIRINRAEMLDVLKQDHVTTARAMGLPAYKVILSYALRNAMLPTMAMIGLRFGWMLEGTIIAESVFDWPGIGLYAVDAAIHSDFQAIMGSAIVLGVAFMVINLIVDLLYGLLDPRIRLQK